MMTRMLSRLVLGALVYVLPSCGGEARPEPAAPADAPRRDTKDAPEAAPQVAPTTGAKDAPSEAPQMARASSPDGGSPAFLTLEENTAFCVRLHEELADCAAEFIDLNIELRSHYFPEFKKRIETPEALAEARRIGIREALADGTGPIGPRRKRCTEYAAHGPPSPRSVVPEAEDCYALRACKEKIECIRPILEARYRARSEGR